MAQSLMCTLTPEVEERLKNRTDCVIDRLQHIDKLSSKDPPACKGCI